MKKYIGEFDRFRAIDIEISPSVMWSMATIAALTGMAILIAYQSMIGVDFPHQDEWGYVDRLARSESVGLVHYLFDVYQVYFMPGTLAIWYLFYHYLDLDIMAIRYSGAVISPVVGLFISSIMIKGKSRHNLLDLGLVTLAPFVICSLNLWATYNQSIESVIEPLLFGCVLIACWTGQKTMDDRNSKAGMLGWSIAVIIASLAAVSMYAPGLSVLLAVAIARIIVSRKLDVVSIGLGLLGLGGGLLYMRLGGGGGQHIPLASVHIIDVIDEWVILFGNALLTQPVGMGLRRLAGAVVILFMGISTIRLLFLPVHHRLRCFVPLALSIYTFGVSLEIVWAYHTPEFGHAPRYAVHMMGGPISVLMWAIMLPRTTVLKLAVPVTAMVILISTLVATRSTSMMVPYFRVSFDKTRAELLSVNAPISDEQQEIIQVGTPLKHLVYPDLEFLRKNRLALYRVD